MLLIQLPGLTMAMTVVDDSGRTVHLETPAQRVVALAPHVAEMLFAVGAGDTLVGVIEGSDFPQAAEALPRVGSYRGIPLEAIVIREPDLVITWASGTPRELVERLRALGIAVYESEPRQLVQVAEDMRELGRLTGHAVEGKAAAETFRQRLEALRQVLSPAPRVFFQLGHDPLTTLAGGHIVTEVIRHCGGEPLFADSPVLVPQIGREALIEARPEVILAVADNDAWKRQWQALDVLPAVRHHRLYTLDPDAISRPGPRILQAVEAVCRDLAQP
ncbi:cobalamin-binding protein [Halomonas shantousis]